VGAFDPVTNRKPNNRKKVPHMYAVTNYKTKKAIRDEITRAGHAGPVFDPGPGLGGPVPTDGTVTLEGPHYPAPHRWYAVATLANGRIVGVR